jgi:hypothetical protein
MSAAPELLAALGNLLARYDEMNEERWESNEDDRQTLAARALLAKLSGGAK